MLEEDLYLFKEMENCQIVIVNNPMPISNSTIGMQKICNTEIL